ncbi:MAG: NAD-dependent epimerase/dehydratase family protein [Desulfatibacillaceae bacterium]|nr:NAD-dependent epimerase/dehydratase family protein [Desulfatibacillaceae bacterium]
MAREKRSVLVTGVAHEWGRRLVPLLEKDPDIDTLIGIDYREPKKPFKRLEFFQIEPHHPLLAEMLKVANVDTVCHLLFEDAYSPSEELFDLNVMGTMDLLAACGAGEVKRMVVMSATEVYGAVAHHPNFLYEHTEFAASRRLPYSIHRVEIENIIERYNRQNEFPKTCILRFANILGWGVDTPLARYLDSSMVPTVFGFDPMYQLTHALDVVDCLYLAVKNDISGVFNVAGSGLLPLSQLIKLVRRIPLPFGAPFLRLGTRVFQKTPVPDSIPIGTEFLKFSCVGDTDKMRDELGFCPRFSSKQTVIDFVEKMRVSRYMPNRSRMESDPKATERLQDYLKSKRRADDYLTELIETFNKECGHDQ